LCFCVSLFVAPLSFDRISVKQQCIEHLQACRYCSDTDICVSACHFLWLPFLTILARSHKRCRLGGFCTTRSLHYSKSDCRVARAPALSPCSSLTHAHRSIAYRNRNPQPLAESAARLMYLRVYDSRDSSSQPAPSPSLCYSLTHAHRSIGYRKQYPQPLAESAARLMYLRVYDSRVSSHQPAPSPSLCYLLTRAHSTLPTPTLLTITYTQVLWFLERLTWPTVSCCVIRKFHVKEKMF